MCSLPEPCCSLCAGATGGRLYVRCAPGALSSMFDAWKCRPECQSQHRSTSGGSLQETSSSGKASNSFAGKNRRSVFCFASREGVERHRCCRLPGSQKCRRTIYPKHKACRRQRAWHRSGWVASDGEALIGYSLPTTALHRVGATLQFSELPTTRECQKLLGFSPCGVSLPLIFLMNRGHTAGSQSPPALVPILSPLFLLRRAYPDTDTLAFKLLSQAMICLFT